MLRRSPPRWEMRRRTRPSANGSMRTRAIFCRTPRASIETKPETVMLLLTTLYFKDQWRDEFWENATKEDTFTAANGAQQTVDFMHLTQDRAAYCRGENYTVAELALSAVGRRCAFCCPMRARRLKSFLADGERRGRTARSTTWALSLPMRQTHLERAKVRRQTPTLN